MWIELFDRAAVKLCFAKYNSTDRLDEGEIRSAQNTADMSLLLSILRVGRGCGRWVRLA